MAAISSSSQASAIRFSLLPISNELKTVAEELGFDQLTPIQAQSIPLLLEGRDLVGQSKTGSGKTIAFALPALEKLDLQLRRLQALILCPTRELCDQVTRELRKLGRRHPGLQVVPLAGGQPIYLQLSALEKGAHIAVGTPGRVLDHLTRRTLDLRRVRYLVLDEADRMLDMGFEEDMKRILSEVPKDRQTVFFSATFPPSIAGMSRAYQKDPARVTIEEEPESRPSIRQVLYEMDPESKLRALLWILKESSPESAIIFCNLKATVAEVARALARAGVSVEGLHGDLEQSDRDRVMAKFRNQSTRVLVATDVAARGIDVEDLDMVVNYDLPQPDVYVHRIGRTGRAGKTGVAISFAGGGEKHKLRRIEEEVRTAIEREELPRSARHELAEESGLGLEARMDTLYISGGRKDKVRPGDILGALTGEAGGLDASVVGKIEIHDRFSYVAVASEVADTALRRLRDGRIKGRKFRVEKVR